MTNDNAEAVSQQQAEPKHKYTLVFKYVSFLLFGTARLPELVNLPPSFVGLALH